MKPVKKQGLYDPQFEHDNCGVGFVSNIDGNPTHTIIEDGLNILKNLVHRGAVGGDQKTGDGAGMLIQIPHDFFNKISTDLGFKLPDFQAYGAGFLFMPQKNAARKEIVKIVEDTLNKEGATLLCWRDVPVQPGCLGEMALESMPFMRQIFIKVKDLKGEELQRRLYIIRKCIEQEVLNNDYSIQDFYIPSLSCSTITYKGMFDAPMLEEFYTDFADPDFKSPIAVVHQRYSTNTFPSWPLAQPFRHVAHNGEINTLRGNVNKMCARESTLESPLYGDEIKKLFPIIEQGNSDSGSFDNAYELLIKSGRSLEHSMIMMIPEAFGPSYHISVDKKAFYEYHASMMEPWDGPAAMVFTDGFRVGALLDRNGLRPARYIITKTGKVVMGSEVGVLDINPEDVLKKGRLAPGKMILIDTIKKRVLRDNEIKASVSRRKPYRHWLNHNRIELMGLFQVPATEDLSKTESLITLQKAFGYTLEGVEKIILAMAENAQEPIGSMGDDEALAVLSERPQLLYRYFKQLFAQVTNPPIDPYRENLVMSLMSFIGRERNLLDETPQHCHQIKLTHPILTNDDLDKLRKCEIEDVSVSEVPIIFKAHQTKLDVALDDLCKNSEKQIDNGASLIILTDRGVNETYAPIPALLATSAVHHHLVLTGKRHLAGLVVETGEARDVMHFATLIGYGASAVNPYLVFTTLAEQKNEGKLENFTLETAIENYITAIKKGLLKIMSKMGISTIRSYKGAQLFEALGLSSAFIEKYFTGTPTRIEGIGIDEIEKETLKRHDSVYKEEHTPDNILDPGGSYHMRSNSQNHLLTGEAIVILHKALRENNYDYYKKYTALINDQSQNLCTLRGLFNFKKSNPIPIDQVEPIASIVKRFVSSAMSYGSISPEAHRTMAIAMNRIGAQSNSGEGGEDEDRFKKKKNGDWEISKVKQIASGRFGVSSNYLANAEELQIKMAQGAKPGEGGQLPGHKVSELIASVRYSTPGVMLISPPPHHDIYSIEDLAQLIFDLKNSNPKARISVKLVSEVGVGTVAAGVAKGKAEMVLISGHDGGTGASPLSSVKYAGIPWEIGLAETQQTLVLNKLRDKIRVQVDGQLKTGRDIVIGALLGAEEFGFGTMSLVSLGCVMMRKCHLDACPVGVATQDEELRKRFKGKPEHMINFMNFIAQDVREIMAELGFKTFDEMVGQINMIETDKAVDHYKAKGLDFSNILFQPEIQDNETLYASSKPQHDFSNTLDFELIKKAKPALDKKTHVEIPMPIRNRNRTAGTMLSYEVSKRFGSEGLPDDTISCSFKGSAGQSFGAFLAKGITFQLEGDANDYVGKGLSGGIIILTPPKEATFRPQNNIITGNVNLFGATSGEMFIRGKAGERFCVRNSGANAVVEGVGDHACEYMTGGRVVILGSTGVNFAAGMSGGIAYVLDSDQLFDTRCNLEMVELSPIIDEIESKFLYDMINRHVELTSSAYAAEILHDWEEMRPQFVKVLPIDYKKALERLKNFQSKETELVTVTEEVY